MLEILFGIIGIKAGHFSCLYGSWNYWTMTYHVSLTKYRIPTMRC